MSPNDQLINSPGFNDDPTDDKSGGRFERLITKVVGSVLSVLGISLPSTATLTGSTGSKTYSSQQVTVNQSGTAGFIGWIYNAVETAVGSGTKLLADWRVGGTSKFKITDAGAVTAAAGITAGTTLTATLGNITAVNGELVASTLGKGLSIQTGANGRAGISNAMTSGAVEIPTTAVAAGDIVLYSRAITGGTTGQVSAVIDPGVKITLTSTSNTETSTFNWMIVKDAA